MTSRKTTSADTGAMPDHQPRRGRPMPAMSQCDVAVLAETFRQLGDLPSAILLQCMHGLVAVGTSPKARPVAVSGQHHLRLLRCAPVRGETPFANIFYSIADQHVSQVLQDMAVHIEDKADD